jgi:hypothetical protein
MPEPWSHLDDLIRELGEIRSLPQAANEQSLAAATLAIAKATGVLVRASESRGRPSDALAKEASRAIDEARRVLAQARAAILQSLANRSRSVRADSGGEEPSGESPEVLDEIAVTCHACARDFRVQYRAGGGEAALVAMPVACPFPSCDGVTEVAYPASAHDVSVTSALSSSE